MNMNKRFHSRFSPVQASLLILPLVIFGSAGCSDDDQINEFSAPVDLSAPGIPAGVSSITGDGAVFVRWIPNKEPDLAGYRVWWDGDGDEEFEELARVEPFEDGIYQDNQTPTAADDFLEYGDVLGFDYNGTYNSYAISAYDHAGNESDLSWELVVDVPRPEGYDLRLETRTAFPQFSGYDLSALSEQAQPWDELSTDVWFDVDDQGVHFFEVPTDFVRILDAGFQSDEGFGGIDGVDFAPLHGWSARGVVEAINGHTYVLRIRNGSNFGEYDHYAKIWLDGVVNGGAILWWAYQEVPGERQFGQPRPDADEAREFVSREEVR